MSKTPRAYMWDGRRYIQVPCIETIEQEIGPAAASLTLQRLDMKAADIRKGHDARED
jgi:hypothetical protein